MNKTISLFLLVSGCLIMTGCTNVRTVGNINGLDVTRVTTRGVFSPSTTTVVLSDPSKPGTIESIDSAHGPGFVPAVANAAGVAGGAALLRPARTKVSNEGGSSFASGGGATSNGNVGATANSNATGGAGGNGGGTGNTQNGAIHHNNP